MDNPTVSRRGDWTDVVVYRLDESNDIPVTHPVVDLHLEHELVVRVVDEREVMNQSMHRHNPGIPDDLSPPVIHIVDQQVLLERVPWYFEIVQWKDRAVSVAFSFVRNKPQERQR